MLIFGFGKREYKVLGETAPKKCGKCSHERPFKYVEETRWFSLFFVPLFPYKTRKLVVCTVCGAGIEDKEGIAYTNIDPKEKEQNRESLLQQIKEKFDRGEISKNEYIRMVNVLKFETQHTH